MTELYLVAHKVRGEPAFDVAIKMDCPLCEAQGCHECDDTGYFWIIPTSGHRAYPYWYCPLDEMACDHKSCLSEFTPVYLDDPRFPKMPPDLPDHYPHREAPKQDLISLLGLIHKPSAPRAPIKRRF